GRDRPRVRDRAAEPPRERRRRRRAADLAARHPLQHVADRALQLPEAALVAAEPRELAVLEREVGDGVERGHAGEQVGVPREQEQALLRAHAAADGVHPPPVDAQPGQRQLDDARHLREVVDLPRRPPRLEREHPSLSVGADDGEAALRRQRPPQMRVPTPGDAAPVRRDHERQARVPLRPVPRREHHVCSPALAVVRAIVDLPHAHGRRRRCLRRQQHSERCRDEDGKRDPRSRSQGGGAYDIGTTKSSVPVRPERLMVRVTFGTRSRRDSVGGRRALGTTIVTWTDPRAAASVYESGPNLVGTSFTAIRSPGRSQARGVAYARWRPAASSCTSISRSVSSSAAFDALFGGRYIARSGAPASGATLAASPETKVSRVIPAARVPYKLRTSWSGSSMCAKKRAAFSPYTSSVPETGNA